MKKTVLFTSLMYLLISTCALAAGGTLPGSGTETDPYLIEDLADFDAFADSANAATYWAAGVHTKLMTNIDLFGRTYTTAVIAPDTGGLSNSFGGVEFSGNFNGNNLIIYNLVIDTDGVDNDYLGFIGWIDSSAEVKNLGIENIGITGETGSDYVGGLAGLSYYGSNITNCHSTGSINSDGYGIGGLVGENNSNTINNCYSTCLTNGNDRVGGLIGYSYSTVTNCYATGNVNGTSRGIGGLIGENNNGTIENSYATGNISSKYRDFGGLIGTNVYGTVTNCYATGLVSGSERVGGLMGWNDSGSILTNNFWDINTSSTSDGIGSQEPDPAGVIGKTTTEMMTQSSFAGWDFTTPVWMMLREGEDYPRLAWQEVFAGDIAGLYGADMVDFAYLANYWGLTGCNSGTDCGRADIDNSGDVAISDLLYIAQDWLE